jgi:hypothetical protein
VKKADPIVTPDMVRELRADEAELNALHAELEKAMRAGIDLRMEIATTQAMIRQVAGLLDTYGGGRKRA